MDCMPRRPRRYECPNYGEEWGRYPMERPVERPIAMPETPGHEMMEHMMMHTELLRDIQQTTRSINRCCMDVHRMVRALYEEEMEEVD